MATGDRRRVKAFSEIELSESAKADRDLAQALGRRIRSLREKRAMTQNRLALLCCRGRSAVAQWECGLTSPSLGSIAQIARCLETSAEYLAFGIEDGIRTVEKAPADLGIVVLPVVEFDASRESRMVGRMGLDFERVREMNVRDPEMLVAWKATASCSDPDVAAGDRLVVDTSVVAPNGRGLYLWWDGFAPVVVDLSIGPGREAALRAGRDIYRFPADEVLLIGRILERCGRT